MKQTGSGLTRKKRRISSKSFLDLIPRLRAATAEEAPETRNQYKRSFTIRVRINIRGPSLELPWGLRTKLAHSKKPGASAREMVDSEPRREEPKELIATRVTGTVKWFNAKSGYGFIIRDDTKEDLFIHHTVIVKNNPKKAVRSVGEGEIVEFDVVAGEKGTEASNVSGPEGFPVKGSPYAPDRRRGKKIKCDTPNQRVHPELRRSSALSEDEDLIGWCIVHSIPELTASEQYTVQRDEELTPRD